jgi:hypothetical protein
MRALKVLVVVMGVMLVAGVVVLAVAIANRIAYRHAHPTPIAPMIAARHGEHHTVVLPAGARILGITGDGGRMILRLGLADGSEAAWLIDWRTGARLATIDLRATPAPR